MLVGSGDVRGDEILVCLFEGFEGVACCGGEGRGDGGGIVRGEGHFDEPHGGDLSAVNRGEVALAVLVVRGQDREDNVGLTRVMGFSDRTAGVVGVLDSHGAGVSFGVVGSV